MPKSPVYFQHDTQPSKARLRNPDSSTNQASRGYHTVTCHRLRQYLTSWRIDTRGAGVRNKNCPWVTPWGLVCRRGRVTQAGFATNDNFFERVARAVPSDFFFRTDSLSRSKGWQFFSNGYPEPLEPIPKCLEKPFTTISYCNFV